MAKCTLSGLTSLAFCLFWLFAENARGQQPDDVLITTHHINPVRDARTPWDEIQNCLRDTACAAAVNGIAAQVGIPANAIRLVSAGAARRARRRAIQFPRWMAARFAACRSGRLPSCPLPATGHRSSPSAPLRPRWQSIRGRRAEGLVGEEAGTMGWSLSLT
jgi:hypothetical protein